MATNYPTSVDTPTDPTSGSALNSPSHAGEHSNANDAVVAIENTVGFTGAFNFLPTTGGTMSGAIAMGSHKVTGLTNGSGAQDAAAFGQIPTAVDGSLTIGGKAVSATAGLATNDVLQYNGTNWVSAVVSGGGGVSSVTAGDTSIVVGGTGTAPTIATATLDVIATDHAPAANWSNNSHKITSLANGSAAQDAAAFGQIPVPSTTPTASTVPEWDANKNLAANNLNEAFTTTATAAGTTTLTVGSTAIQFFTGSTTQTVVLPVVATLATGFTFRISNLSTGAVTVQSSGANTIVILAAGTSADFTCILITGTTAASWQATYLGDLITSGKSLSVSNSLTLAGTDSTTMTFPSTSATIARTDSAQTFTGVQTFSSSAVLSSGAVTVSGNAITFPTTAQTLVGRTTTDTLTNKRVTKRVLAITSSFATPTFNTDNFDTVNITGLNTAITNMSTNATGTPVAGDMLIFYITDAGSAEAITWGSLFESTANALLPTTTSPSARVTVGFEWNEVASKWDCVVGTAPYLSTLTVASNAVTVPVLAAFVSAAKVTNNAAATAAITLTTTGATEGQKVMVMYYDSSAATQTLTWVNTENSVNATVPGTSIGSTTLPTMAEFVFNSGTSKWRCMASDG